MIGDCGLSWQDVEGEKMLEVGYHLREDMWHQGYAAEASVACKRYAFEKLDAAEVCSIIRENNLASQRVAIRNGMLPCRYFVKPYWGVDMPHIVFSVKRENDQGYIRSLRRYVGHRPILLCGASVIVENDKGEILLQKRCDNHLWGYAGGSIELDENTQAAAARELLEETGLIADELTLFNVFSGPDLHHVYPNGDEVSCIDIVYVCRRYHGALCMQAEEVEDLRFFSLDQLPPWDQLSPPIRLPLKAYLAARE